jgi:DNA replication licensing factor MCM3
MFMRKYIHLAKGLKPQLTKDATDMIAEEYTKLRNQDRLIEDHLARTQPVTVRSLETLIRLATAHAKARLSNKVEARDAEVAIELVRYACFKKVLEKEKRTNKRKDISDDEEDEQEIVSEEEDEQTETLGATESQNNVESQSSGKPKAKKTRTKTITDDATEIPSSTSQITQGSSSISIITADR